MCTGWSKCVYKIIFVYLCISGAFKWKIDLGWYRLHGPGHMLEDLHASEETYCIKWRRITPCVVADMPWILQSRSNRDTFRIRSKSISACDLIRLRDLPFASFWFCHILLGEALLSPLSKISVKSDKMYFWTADSCTEPEMLWFALSFFITLASTSLLLTIALQLSVHFCHVSKLAQTSLWKNMSSVGVLPFSGPNPS